MKIGIIGGGAAGFFAAIHVKENYPDYEVVILEKSKKVLSKVKISGGGRCNVTNACSDISELIKAYPRGGKELRKLFHEFNTRDTRAWFENRGVDLVVEKGGHIFPKTQDSQTIIDCFLEECRSKGIKILTQNSIKSIHPISKNKIDLISANDEKFTFDKVIVTTGGSPKLKGLIWLEELGHKIEMPVPSLFTFNMPNESITKLMGVVVENVTTKIEGEKISAQGPLLITHWGMSGPAIIILSAHAARVLENKNYHFKVLVNWLGNLKYDKVLSSLNDIKSSNSAKSLKNTNIFSLPNRLWEFLLNKLDLDFSKQLGEVSKKDLNRLTNVLVNDSYDVSGKTTFKEEFVTCGGVSLKSVNVKTMESKHVPNLYFAGEVLDIDAITGGFNFQSAWTTGYIAAKLGA